MDSPTPTNKSDTPALEQSADTTSSPTPQRSPTVFMPGQTTTEAPTQADNPNPVLPLNGPTISSNVVSFTTTANSVQQRGVSTKHILPVAIALVLIALIGGILYFWTLPRHTDSHYKSTISDPYSAQAANMLTVYESFGQPVFTSNGTSTKTDTQNLHVSNVAIETALGSTATLKAVDHLSVLPGTAWFGQTKNTVQQYEAVKQYVQNSQNFLADYQSLTTYISDFEQIETKQVPGVTSSLSAVSTSQTPQQLLASCQNASSSMSALVTSLNGLQPPVDLRSFNTTTIQDFSAVNTALENIVSGISNSNAQQIESAASQLGQAGATLEAYSTTDIAGMLQKGSTIHRQIVQLEMENPLGTPRKTITIPSLPGKATAT
jgi:hypothetical protein